MKNLISQIKTQFSNLKNKDWKAFFIKTAKDPIFWARFSAYTIPFAFLLYVLYMNFLPFGYHKTFTIEVGGPNDTKVSEFYLEPSKDLSDRKIAPDGTPYRELNGSAFAIFKSNAVLKDALVNVSVEGDGVSIIPPVINLDPNTTKWDYSWDFTKEIPKDLKGNAFMFDGEATFNGRDTRLELASSSDMFEDGPFTIYAEWEPRDSEHDAEQIVGHLNWELWQNKNSVSFQVGRMNNATGTIYTIKYPISKDFFNKKHSALAIYNPSSNGYIDLYIDGKITGRTYFNSENIWKDYGKENLSFGWSPHNYQKNPYLFGVIYSINIISKNIIKSTSSVDFKVINNNPLSITILSTTTSTIKQLKLNVSQKNKK
ncbi:MAG: hypothetical protein WCL61_03655 [bacterium]